jgi:hypothetical protein
LGWRLTMGHFGLYCLLIVSRELKTINICIADSENPGFIYCHSPGALGKLEHCLITINGIDDSENHRVKNDIWALLRQMSVGYVPIASDCVGDVGG